MKCYMSSVKLCVYFGLQITQPVYDRYFGFNTYAHSPGIYRNIISSKYRMTECAYCLPIFVQDYRFIPEGVCNARAYPGVYEDLT